jgi:PiT family inorganic phosphate transporter
VDIFGLVLVIAVAFGFAYTNGFHDSANAIATSVSTRALTPKVALLMAALMNLLGAFLGEGVAQTVSKGIIATPTGGHGMVILWAALIGAITWNLFTWYFGLPSSSSHALFGGMVGAALAGGTTVYWSGLLDKVIIPMVTSPVAGLLLGFALMVSVMWIFRRTNPHRAKRGFRMAQTVSAAAMALGHGLQDTQKTMGVVVMALTISGHYSGHDIPVWVKISTAIVMALGTWAGGWRIMRTLGRRIIELDPPQGFAAESVSALVLYVTAYAYKVPVSTTHVITSAIMGVGATKRVRAVRWGVAKDIVLGWFITLPAAGLVAAVIFWLSWAIVG